MTGIGSPRGRRYQRSSSNRSNSLCALSLAVADAFSWQAGVLMRRWDALFDGSALRAVHGGSALGQVRPRFVSSEIFLQLLARRALHACMVGPERVVAPASSLT